MARDIDYSEFIHTEEVPVFRNKKGMEVPEKTLIRALQSVRVFDEGEKHIIVKLTYHTVENGRWERRELREIPKALFDDGESLDLREVLDGWQHLTAYKNSLGKDSLKKDKYAMAKRMSKFISSTDYIEV